MPRTKKIEQPPTPPPPTAPPKTWLQEQMADKGFWHSVIGAFVGGILAIFAGLTVYTIQAYNQHAHELKIKSEQERILLEGFKKSLEDNLKIMNGIIDVKNPTITMNNLNLNYFQSTSQIKYQTLTNIKLAEEIDDLTFRLNSLEQAVKNYQSIFFNPLNTMNKGFLKTTARDLHIDIILGGRQTMIIAGLVLKDVDAELDKLDKTSGNSVNP
jgi:hypothetical protein